MRPPRIRDHSSYWRSFSSVVPSLIMTEDRRAPMESSFRTESQCFCLVAMRASAAPARCGAAAGSVACLSEAVLLKPSKGLPVENQPSETPVENTQ
jgi:hypothetical protein